MLALILLAPLASAAILGLFGRRMNERAVGVVACSAIGVATVISFYVFFAQLLAAPDRRIFQYVFTWISVGSFRADAALLLDPLSGIYILFITFVGFWIHVFATGYMRGEQGYWRFFAYMNLFMFAMLTLVLGDNFLLMFVGWEGVGLCSYLLIGFYYLKDFANDAAKKAFIVNRIGDFGFALGVMLLFWKAGTIFYFDDAARGVHGAFDWAMRQASDPFALSAIFAGGITTIAVLLFTGATGKSAQIPLFVWLPDAMAGPTPVSALIHAATMVTAGVYMVSRASSIYVHAPAAMFIIALVGVATAFFAATVGLAQWDIKKVLAYSTISQLGYMFLACGVGAFGAGIFHVFTHAFFKALLFLGAGSVIVGLHHEQDMRRMGGLRRYMPATYWTMVVGWLAIAGVPLLSGFFSKDAILYSALKSDSLFPAPWPGVLWAVGAITALITAVYMTRLIVLTFWGEERFRQKVHDPEPGAHVVPGDAATGEEPYGSAEHTPHESSPSMVIPLVILAVGAIFAGYLNIPADFGGGRFSRVFDELLEPAISSPITSAPAVEQASGFLNSEIGLAVISSVIAILGILIGWFWFRRQPLWEPPRLLEEKYRVDEAYDKGIVQSIKVVSVAVLWKVVDNKLIDGAVNGAARVAGLAGRGLGHLQSGLARGYVATIVLGALLIIGYFVIAR
jgi:NADH-quinone oxidoreductase subunit L